MEDGSATTAEIRRLRRCINDLVSVVALPAVWTGRDSAQILQACFDALERMLELDLVYARLTVPIGDRPFEVLRVAPSLSSALGSADIGDELRRWFGELPQAWPPILKGRGTGGSLSIVPLPLGVQGELGVIAAGSERTGFPEREERLVLSVAANQVAIALQGARVFDEQRRVASELDRRVVERTLELQRSEAFLAQAQQLSSTGSFSWRVSSGEMRCSEQLRQIFALGAEQPLTLEALRDLAHPDDRSSVMEILERARRGGADFECEHRLLLPDQIVKHVHLVAEAKRGSQGELEYIGAVQDVSERKLSDETLGRVRSELAHVSKMSSLGALAASIAHEVNQPLAGVVTNASTCLRMLAVDPPDVTGAVQTVRRMLRDGNRAADVIARLRALFSKKAATIDAVDLNDATREVIALTVTELQRCRAVLRLDLAENLPPVAGDRVQLQQVILNLLLNASEAMGAVGDRPRQLLVKTEIERGRARLSVQDAGVGFEPSATDRLFEAFHTTKSNGMGIGLSVSRSIIDRHHGRLWAESNDGPGATFAFELPLSPSSSGDQ